MVEPSGGAVQRAGSQDGDVWSPAGVVVEGGLEVAAKVPGVAEVQGGGLGCVRGGR